MKIFKIIAVNLILLMGVGVFFEFFLRKTINFDAFYYGMKASKGKRNFNIHPYGKIPINKAGFYDNEWNIPKTKPRFAINGDSVIYGVGAGYPFRITEYLDDFKANIEHINISAGIGTDILSMGSNEEIIEFKKNYQVDKLIYALNLNDISSLAYEYQKDIVTGKNRPSRLKQISNFIKPLDNIFRSRSVLYSYTRLKFKNFLVMKTKKNITGFRAIELEPNKFEKDIRKAAKNLAYILNKLNNKSLETCVLMLPYEMQISKDAAIVYKKMGIYFDDNFTDFSTQRIFINEFKKNSNLKIHYLGKIFKEKPVGFYYVFNKGDKIDFNHPNRKGHYVLSEEIASKNFCY